MQVDRSLTETGLDIARFLGKRITEIARKMSY